MPTPTCQLLISGITADGLPRWQPSTAYWGLSNLRYPDLIVDSNGNYQAVYAYGVSAATVPTWGTGVGDYTDDGPDLIWRRVIPIEGNEYTALAYPLAAVQLGASLTLTWISTDATSASISGIGTVPTSGSMIVTPDISLFYNGTFDYNQNLIFNVPGGGYQNCVSLNAANYLLTVTGTDGSTTSLAMFMLISPAAVSKIYSFAPVSAANGSDYGGTGTALTPVVPSYPPWTPSSSYTRGTEVLDSNGNGQVSVQDGVAAMTAPTWAGVGDLTTETTGLSWRNVGQIYPSTLRQTGFGPLWNRPNSSVEYGFEDMVIPDCIDDIPAYAINTAYNVGDVVSITFGSSSLSQSGIIYFGCFHAGTTGSTDPSGGSPYDMHWVKGMLMSDAAFNPGGTPVWKVMGSLTINLSMVGTVIDAPDGYSNSPTVTGAIPSPVFDGTVQTKLLMSPTDINSFLTTPSDSDITYSAGNTAGVPTTGEPPECPTWENLALDTGYINTACADGFDASVGGVWAEFDMPYTFPPNGTITVIKRTVPSGLTQDFIFGPSYGSPFSLSDGESNASGPIAPGTYSVAETPVANFVTTTDLDPTAIMVEDGENVTITFTNTYRPYPPVPARVLPILKIPNGQGQSVDELDGQSSIAGLEVETIDPTNEVKYLATKAGVVGRFAYFKLGFKGMNLSDFVPLHTVQISSLGRTAEGWMKFGCRDNLALLDRALWFCGGPQPVALPWLYGQRYEVGQYVQDYNGNIEQCIVAGTTSSTTPPIWPGTTAPVWQPNISYTLGYWAIDNLNGNLQAVTTVPSGHTSTRPLNTGVSGNGFPNPSWGDTIGAITPDNSGGNPNGPITWTCIAINDLLGIEVADNNVVWELVAKPYQGAFGGSQAFYVFNLFGQTVQVPEPPATFAFTSNQYPTIDGNPRYIYGNPIDALLVALQNELGLGQNPLLPPIVTTDPNDPQNALVFAPNPLWQQYTPGDDTTLINPNPFLNLTNILYIRDNEASGRKFEWAIKRPVTAKSWIQEQILKPLGLYMYTHADGTIDLKSMKSPLILAPTAIDNNTIDGIPSQDVIPVVNVVTVRGDVDDEGAYSAARVYDAEITFAQQDSLALYKQEFSYSVESNGMREAYDSYGIGYLLADRIFRRHGFSTPVYTLKANLGWLRLELGDFILLSHPLMMDYKSPNGRIGVYNVICEIVDRQPDYASGMVTLKVWDCRFLQQSTAYLIAPLADAIPNWPAATPAQRKKYMFVSYWPGWMSDGADGPGIF